MIKKLETRIGVDFDKIVNYITSKQSAFNTYFKSFPKDFKVIKKTVKKIDKDNINISYIEENDNILFVAYELINAKETKVDILFMGLENIKILDVYKQFLKYEYNSYKISIISSKFNLLHNEFLNDNYFVNCYNKKTIEVFETKLNKLKYRMNQDILVFPLENHLKDDYKNIHKSKITNSKKINRLVVLYNNEMIGYFDYISDEEYNEIIEYKLDERINDKEIVIGKALLYIFDHHGKFKNIKLSLIDDPNFNEFMKCKFLLIAEENIFSN